MLQDSEKHLPGICPNLFQLFVKDKSLHLSGFGGKALVFFLFLEMIRYYHPLFLSAHKAWWPSRCSSRNNELQQLWLRATACFVLERNLFTVHHISPCCHPQGICLTKLQGKKASKASGSRAGMIGSHRNRFPTVSDVSIDVQLKRPTTCFYNRCCVYRFLKISSCFSLEIFNF